MDGNASASSSELRQQPSADWRVVSFLASATSLLEYSA